jgi:UDP-GlcNAc:undecaprenyl-phosphate GlcNAc-1-phosphate transferase
MYFIELSLVFFLSLLLIKVIQKFSLPLHLVDLPTQRKTHEAPTPTGAGIAIVISVFCSLLLFDFTIVLQYSSLFLSILIVFALGVIDDTTTLTPYVKIFGISVALTIVCYEGYVIDTIGSYFGHEFHLYWLIAYPLTYFSVIGFTNALNLIDGLDGLAASISIVILTAFWAIGVEHNDTFITLLSSLFVVSLLAFLIFNWHPASIFMGDSGSLTLGFIISILAIKSLEYIAPTSILFLTALPIINTMVVFYRRKQRHLSAFNPNHIHLHDLILSKKRSISFTVIMLCAIQIVFSMIGYSSLYNDNLFNLIEFFIIFYIFINLFDQREHIRVKK